MERYVPLPPLPARIGRLNELAYDLWWSWNPVAREVFRDLDYPLWRFTDHNPVLLLHLVEPERLEFAANDTAFLDLYDRAVAELDAIRAGTGSWWHRRQSAGGPIAWIAPRFALHQSLPVHATADAVVAGEFAREASDLGLPFVGVGLMYPRAYPHQRLTPEGWQQEAVEYIDWSDAPITPATRPDGSPCTFTLPVGGTHLHVAVWQVCAGRSRVYLLDTDVADNAPWDRDLSSRAPGGDADVMLRQSVLLGAGAVAALERLEIEPAVWHLAGGQAALVILDRLDRLLASGVKFLEASSQVRASTRFSARVDTPAAAEAVSFGALERHMAFTWPALAAHRPAVLGLGGHETDRTPVFNGAVLAARQSAAVAVATEGVHLPSWISADLARLFDAHVDPAWRGRQDDAALWAALAAIPDEDLWGVRQRLRGYLVDFMRERARRRWAREQASGSRLVALGTLLDAQTLTIGCAPRFGDGGNADSLFHDVDRLARIVTAARHPVQVVFAGRVDGGDEAGKHHVQRAFRQTMDARFGGRLAFLEDYDLHVARLMVQGCDLWLTPPPHAGGPSLGGAKAAVNGVPHAGPRGAWYAVPAAGSGQHGWVVEDARAVYGLIEEQIVPAFYERDRTGLPTRWTSIVRATLASALPAFTARRVLMALTGTEQSLV
ncbi:MAG TPA: alpha-glucan family phosphorylase [Vicinamibacterales bacterium]|nr:alpha-glucan family phosphorylase [Vicinamibacterales bacterium]